MLSCSVKKKRKKRRKPNNNNRKREKWTWSKSILNALSNNFRVCHLERKVWTKFYRTLYTFGDKKTTSAIPSIYRHRSNNCTSKLLLLFFSFSFGDGGEYLDLTNTLSTLLEAVSWHTIRCARIYYFIGLTLSLLSAFNLRLLQILPI